MNTRAPFSCFYWVSRHAKRIGIAGILLLAWQSTLPAMAGVTVVMTNNGCTGYSIDYASTSTFVLASTSVLQVDTYRAFAGGLQKSVCDLEYQYTFDDLTNAVNGKNQSNVPIQWLINGRIRNSILNSHSTPSPPFHIQWITTPTDGNGVRGSVNGTGGAALTTASPAYNVVLTNAITSEAALAFVVESAAPGDSLSIEGSAGVIWSQPLANFTLGQVNFAIIPAQPTDPLAPLLLTFWVHNAGQGSSTVYFPDTFTFTPDPAQSVLRAPSDQAAFPQNSVVASSFACTDGTGAPLPNCVGSSASGAPLNTSTVGAQTFTVTATDSSGNIATSTNTFNVSSLTYATPGSLWTLAGNGNAELFGDAGAAIAGGLALSYPANIAIDSAGNVYIADSANNSVRKVTLASGLISTVAGIGTAGFGGDGAAAIGASLNNPTGIAVDSAGNLYIADTGNSRIRRIDAQSATISTVAGSGSTVYTGDGIAAVAAGLEYPTGVALDGTGNLFIVDSGTSAIRRVDAVSGLISTFAGTGLAGFSGDGAAATAAQLNHPSSLSLDSKGSFYIADAGNNRIRKIDATNSFITTVAGNGVSGVATEGVLATASPLSSPSSVIVDSVGNLYIADTNNNAVHKVDAVTGLLSSIIGAAVSPGVGSPGGFSGDGQLASVGLISAPTGLGFNAQGTLYILDSGNNRVRFVPGAGVVPTPPVIQPTVSGIQGANGWYTGNVSVSWNVVPGSFPITNEMGCGTIAIASDTAGQAVTCTATNAGGTSTSSVTVMRDATPPVVTIGSPVNGQSFTVGQAVSAGYVCSDVTSGVTTCTGSVANGVPLDTSTAGPKSLTVAATDVAGNKATGVASYTVSNPQDTTPPVITPVLAGNLGSNGWYQSSVTVSWNVVDPESAISASSGCGQTVLAQQTNGTKLTCTATSAGGTASNTVTLNIDSKPPLIAILLPLNNQQVKRGSKWPAAYACFDSGSGVQQCNGTVPLFSLIDTSTVGVKQFNVVSTDRAGNTLTKSVQYRVY